MNVTAESHGHAVVFTCKGELTADSLDAFARAVDQHLREARIHDLVLHLEEVPFLDSAALEYLLALQERLVERAGQVKLVKLNETVAKILEVTRLEGCFERCSDVSRAVGAV